MCVSDGMRICRSSMGTMIVASDPSDQPLPSLEPALANIPPIPIKKTLMIVNNFIINTTEFINKFAVLCERKLATISQQTARLEIVTSLLEAKLGSISWLGGGENVSAEGLPEVTVHATPGSAPAPPPGPPPGPPPPSSAPASAPVSTPVPAPAPAPVGVPAKNHPVYGTIFKMKAMGVPNSALEVKCRAEGLDPACLNCSPDEPLPSHFAGANAVAAPPDPDSSDSD